MLGPLQSIADVGIFERETYKNQIYVFTPRQSWMQRVLAISSSTASIVFCLIAFYVFLAIDPRRLVFRHQLIVFLLSFDLLKAIVLLLYPTLALSYHHAYYDQQFCQVVGYFTAVAIEGADLAILAFAIHTFLLIFKPSLSMRVGTSGFVEGGLYKYRYYIYGLSFLIPTVVASLAYINGSGYDSLICWCYLPRSPTWYRFALSWVPRYIIVIFIISVYCIIYFHIIKEFKVVGGIFTTMHKQKLQRRFNDFDDEKPSFYSALKYFLKDMKDRIVPQFVLPEAKKTTERNTISQEEYATNLAEDKDDDNTNDTNDNDDNSNLDKTFNGIDIENIIDDPEIQAQNLEHFKKRQKLIEKQMKSIFIYPFAYCFVWLFPFILHTTQVHYELTHHPIYWLNCAGAFMQPFNGFVDTLVFFYRESPLNYTVLKNFERENELRMKSIIHHESISDTTSLATSTHFTRQSLSASLGVDINNYPKWRRLFSRIGLPLFQLPTEETIAAFRSKFVQNHGTNGNTTNRSENFSAGRIPLPFEHDFSNILNVDYPEVEFRSELGSYSMNFSQNKSNLHSQNSNVSTFNADKRTYSNASSIRSPASGRASLGDFDAINKSRASSLADLSQKNINQNLSTNPHMNKLISYQQQKSKRGPPNLNTLNRKFLDKVNGNKISINAKDDADDMDFLEFLRRGP